MREHRRGTDIAKARPEHVRTVRRGLEPRRNDVSRGDLSPCSDEEVLSEDRVPVTGRPHFCGDRRPARRVRELATGGDTLPLHRSCALQCWAPTSRPRRSWARAQFSMQAIARVCTAGDAAASDADRQAPSGARYALHERLAPSARPTTRKASTDATANAVATRRTGAAARAKVTVRTVLQPHVGPFPWSGDLTSLDSVILPLVRDHSENLSTPPGGACAKWLRRAVRARASAAPCTRGRAAWRPPPRRSARRTRRARR